MKSTKKLISILIALMLVLGYSLPVFAAGVQTVGVTATLNKTSVKAGESITLSLSFDQAVEDVSSFTFYVGYDESLFTYDTAASAMPADYYANCNQNPYTLSYQEQKYATNIAKFGFMHSGTSAAAFDGTDDYAAGVFYNMVFVAKSDITEVSTANFNLNASGTAMLTYTLENGTLGSITNKANLTVNGVEAGTGGDANTVTVSVEPASTPTPAGEYTVAVAAAAERYNRGETAYINADVNKGFAASELIFTYDPEVLTFNEASSTLHGATVNSATAGKIVVERYGTDVAVSDSAAEYVLAFVIKEDTTAASSIVTLTSAGFSEAAASSSQDLTPATITTADAVVNINPVYNVTLPEGFTGEATVLAGNDYTFSANDTNYDYTFTATMGGSSVAVTGNGDGTYTIPNVTGNITVTEVSRTGKTRNVTVNVSEGVTYDAPATATYGTDYRFTITKEEDYNNPVGITIGGSTYTGFSSETVGNTTTVTIPGTALTGDVTITIGKEQSQFAVTINGASGDVTGESKAQAGEPYLFEVTKAEGFDYTVEIKVGNTVLGPEDYDVTSSGNKDSYSIHADKVTGPITITVTKTGQRTVKVDQYLTLDGKKMFLVTVSGTTESGQIFTYDGTAMFHSVEYDAYCFLVITEGTLSEEEAAAKVATASATATEVDYDMDVNMSGLVDANDAQLVYNMYNAVYPDFTEVTMEKFLRADLNFDKKVDVTDSNAIINFIIANR